jgi:hypothetical protein
MAFLLNAATNGNNRKIEFLPFFGKGQSEASIARMCGAVRRLMPKS